MIYFFPRRECDSERCDVFSANLDRGSRALVSWFFASSGARQPAFRSTKTKIGENGTSYAAAATTSKRHDRFQSDTYRIHIWTAILLVNHSRLPGLWLARRQHNMVQQLR
jgi:hypothetical protein